MESDSGWTMALPRTRNVYLTILFFERDEQEYVEVSLEEEVVVRGFINKCSNCRKPRGIVHSIFTGWQGREPISRLLGG